MKKRQPPKLNPNLVLGVTPPFWKLLAGAKPFLLHPNGQRQPATEEEVHNYVQTGQLPEIV